MPQITLDMYQTAGIAMLLFVLGRFLTTKIEFLRKCCIPAPVVGGLIFALVHLGLYLAGIVEFKFDENVKNFFMTLFFTSVGYTACFRLLKKGGKKVLFFLVLAIVMVCFQNVLSAALAGVFDWDLRLGLCTGSIPMIGGHGTAICTVLRHYDPAFGFEAFDAMRHKMPWVVRLKFEEELSPAVQSFDLFEEEPSL